MGAYHSQLQASVSYKFTFRSYMKIATRVSNTVTADRIRKRGLKMQIKTWNLSELWRGGYRVCWSSENAGPAV